MVVFDKKWEEILNAAVKSNRNSTGSDILEQIKANLRKKDKGVYQKWAQKGFDIDHMFIRKGISLLSTLLCIAVEGDHKDIVKTLLDKGASVDEKDNHERTPLHWAIGSGHEDIVRILLDKGASIGAKGSHGKTPLHLAAESGREDIVRILLDKGASIGAKDSHGKTPLHLAAGNGHENAVRILLDKGASVDEKDNHERTPLHCAIESIHEWMVPMLSHCAILIGYKRALKSLIAHEIKLKGLGVEKPEYLQNPNTDLGTEMSKYWDECLKEIGRVKEKKIKNITLYDILVSKGADKLASYIRSRDVSNELEKVNCKNEFPIYGNDLERQYKIGKQRLDALGVGEMGIKYFGGFTNEMGLSSLKIAEYLSNEDIENLEKARIQTINESNHKPGESSKKAPRSFKTNVDVEHAAKKQESASRCIVS